MYRLIVHQPLAVPIDASVPQPLRFFLDADLPSIRVQTVHEDDLARMQHGGTRLAIDFRAETQDLLEATCAGLEMVHDALAAWSLSAGIPFATCLPVQIADVSSAPVRFVAFLVAQPALWGAPITDADVRFLQSAALHWRDLRRGARLRRAARRYASALAQADTIDAFEDAYIGLEGLDSPLAREINLTPGGEVVKTKCKKCGHEDEYRRSVLSGVRAFVRGEFHGGIDEARTAEWKALSDLRHDLIHSRVDPADVEATAQTLLPAAMHHLHGASVHLAHEHGRESPAYQMPSGVPIRFLIWGTADELPDDPMTPIAVADVARWVEHPGRGRVPEFKIQVAKRFTSRTAVLKRPLVGAKESDLTFWDVVVMS